MGQFGDKLDEDKQGSVYRGKLFELSHFLTSFRAYYSWDNEELSGGDWGFAITPSEIERALTLRFLLKSKADLLDQKDALADRANASTLQRIDDFLDDVENELAQRSEDKPKYQRDIHIHQLLERFEVWTAKDLSQTLLMPPKCGCHDQKQACTSCWTKLMHIPGAAYFVNRLPYPMKSDDAASEPGLVTEEGMQQDKGRLTIESSPKGKGSTWFSKLYHEAHIQPATHSMCQMMLPPNRYTFEEYTKIADMVSHLPKEAVEQAANSPVGGAVKTMEKSPFTTIPNSANRKGNHNIYAPDFDFQAHDLVSLWVRGQRNSAAMRHLIQLFSRPNDAEQAHLEEEWKEEHSTPIPEEIRNQVVFRGNHKSTKRRILAETKQVQELIAWAVMNQVAFHQQYMKEQMEAQQEQQKSRKRPTGRSSDAKPPAKKIRTGTEPTISTAKTDATVKMESSNQLNTMEAKLLQACHTYLLRWLGQKHQPLLAILFFAKPSSFPSPAATIYYKESDLSVYHQCIEAGIVEAVQERLIEQQPNIEVPHSALEGGVTLARMDRRLRQGKYDSTSEGQQSPFYLTLKALLQAWGDAMAESDEVDVDPACLTAVAADFDQMYERFHEVLSQEGIVEAAKGLLDLNSDAEGEALAAKEDLSEDTVTRLSKLLMGTNAPWLENCGICGKVGKKHPNPKGTFTTCANCDRSFHEDCCSPSDFSNLQMRELLQNVPKRSELLAVEIPDSNLLPEWRRPNHLAEIHWTTHRLTLRRSVLEDGRFESAGMVLRMTQPSRDSLDFVLSGRLTFDILYADDFFAQYPIGFAPEVEGAMVAKLPEKGAGFKAGFLANDVIVALQFVSFADGEQSLCTKTIHEFGNLDKEARLNLFRAKATEVNVTVLRPDKDLLSQCSKWIDVIRAHNEFMWDLMRHGRLLPICKQCKESPQIASDEEETDRIKREALGCRAICRRLGRQSYSRLFHNEDADSCGVEDCVSLARLDAMMSYIVAMNSNPLQSKSTEMKQLETAFFLPPWASQDQERLFWAPSESVKTPRNLLFRGMGILLRRPIKSLHQKGVREHQQEKRALLRHFLDLFCSWCLPAPESQSKMPPRSALCALSPFSKACSVCKVRPGSVIRNGSLVCNGKYCLRMWNKSMWQEDAVANYVDNSKLIGTTVLVFPDSPWLAHVAQREGLKIDSFGRPIEFVVTFYVPPLGCADGFFLLHPVLSEYQLQFVLDRCSLLQKPPRMLSSASLEQWLEGTVLGLEGVIRVSKTDLTNRISSTTVFIQRVGAHIESCAKSNHKPSAVPTILDGSGCPASNYTRRSSRSRDLLGAVDPAAIRQFLQSRVDRYSQVVACIMRLPTPIMQLILHSWDTWRIADQALSSPADEGLSVNIATRTGKQKKNGIAGVSVGTGLAFPKLTKDNFCIPNPPCQVLYTDLYFTSEDEKVNMARALEHEQLPLPQKFRENDQSRERTIVLCRKGEATNSSAPPEYQGIGWGFELVQWRPDPFVRVGRVHPRSPAAAAGLMGGDIIMSINGRRFDRESVWSLPFICCSILTSPICVARSKNKLDICAQAIQTIGSNGPVKGPLVLRLHRPRSPKAIVASAPANPHPAQSRASNDRSTAAQASKNIAITEAATSNSQPVCNPEAVDVTNVLFPSKIQNPPENGPERVSNDVHTSQGSAVVSNAISEGSGSVTVRVLSTMGRRGQEARPNADTLPCATDQQVQYQIQERRAAIAESAQPETANQHMLSHEQPRAPSQQMPLNLQQVPVVAQASQRTIATADQHTAENAAIALVRASLPILSQNVQATLPTRTPLKTRHLYVAAGMSTVLTKVEAGVYLEAVHKEMPMMGLRLLCPRYTLPTLAHNIRQLTQGQGLERVPRIPGPVWKELLVKDYKRWENEPKDAPKLLKDGAGSFPIPTAKLPLDRTVEEIISDFTKKEALTNQQHQQQQQHLHQQQLQQRQPQQLPQHQFGGDDFEPIQVLQEPRWHGRQQGGGHCGSVAVPPHQAYNQFYPPTHHNMPPQHHQFAGQAQQNPYSQSIDNPAERIRGGGPPGAGGKTKGEILLSSPLSLWHDQVVSFEAETTRHDKSSGEALFIGVVRLAEELQNAANDRIKDIDEIDVACFFSSSLGVFDAPRVVSVDPADLFRVTEGSKHWDLLLTIDNKYAPMSKATKQRQATENNSPRSLRQEKVGKTTGTMAILASTGTLRDSGRILPEGSDVLPPTKEEGTSPQRQERDLQPQQEAFPRISVQISSGDLLGVNTERNSATEKAAYTLSRKHRRPDGFARQLGSLPDGRLVCWFPNDPCALYLHQESYSEEYSGNTFREVVSQSNRNRSPNEKICLNVDVYCCQWGCTFEAKDHNSPLRLAEFQSKGLLQKHNAEFHAYGANSNNIFQFAEKENFFRVGDTPTTKRIISGLTASACALSADLHSTAKTKARATASADSWGQRIVCWPSRYACYLSFDSIMATAKSLCDASNGRNKTKPNPPLLQVAQLLLKIHLLFDLRHHGPTLHLSAGSTQGLQEGGHSTAVKSLADYKRQCSWESQSIAQNGLVPCSLCALTTEAVILEHSNDKREDIEHGQNPKGIGCAIPNSIFLPHVAASAPARGDLGFAKTLLLRIAKSVPSQVYSSRPKGQNDPLANLRNQVWKEGQGFDLFVRECSSVQALAQGLICLLMAFEAEKLPLWWRSGDGWLESAQLLLLSPSLSSLILHLFVLDLAVNEFIETGPREKPLKTLTFSRSQRVSRRFDALSTERRVQLLLEAAANNSISRYHGRHDSLCNVCHDGGTLLCCDFCPKTVHAVCCSPEASGLQRWVCAACTVDITELVEMET